MQIAKKIADMKRSLYVLSLGVFGIATTEFGVVGILPQIAAAFKISIEKAGWLLSSFAITVAVFGPLLVLLLSSFNKKLLLLLVLVVFAISNLISVVASSFTMLIVARILPAFLHPVFWSIALSIAANSAPTEQSAKAVGIVFGGFTIASVLGIPLTTLVADWFNWQASFALCAVVNVLSLGGMWLLLPSSEKNQKQTLGSQRQILKKPILWISFALSCLIIAAMYSTYGYIADYLRKVTRMNGTQVSLMLFIFGVTGVIGNWVAGKLLTKNVFYTTLLFIIALAAMHTLLYLWGIYFLPTVVMVAVWGLIHTGGFLISNINLTSSASEAPEFVNSIFTTCGNLAVTIGSLIGGFWITHFHIHYVVWSSVLLLLMSLIACIIKQAFMKQHLFHSEVKINYE